MGKRLSQQELRTSRHEENVTRSIAKRDGKKIVGFRHSAYEYGVAQFPIYEKDGPDPDEVLKNRKVRKSVGKEEPISMEDYLAIRYGEDDDEIAF